MNIKRSKPIKRVTFSKIDEIFDEIEIVDEWAVIYHPKKTKPIKTLNPAVRSPQSDVLNMKQIENKRREKNKSHFMLDLSEKNSSLIEKIKYTKLSKFYDPVTETTKQPKVKRRSLKTVKSPQPTLEKKSIKKRIIHRRTMTKEIANSANFQLKIPTKEGDTRDNTLNKWKMQRSPQPHNNSCAIKYLSSIPNKRVDVDLRTSYDSYESTYHCKDVAKNNRRPERPNNDYLTVTSRNLKKLNCKTNRSVSQESLVGAMMKGASFKIMYPEQDNNNEQVNKSQMVYENPQYFSTNMMKILIPSTKIDMNSSIISNQRKLCCVSLLSPTLSLIEGNPYEKNENCEDKVADEYIGSDQEERNSLIHLSTDES